MKLPEFGVKRPVTATMIFLCFVMLGSVAYSLLGLDVMPDIEIPSVSIITVYRGAGPEEIEMKVTKPLEEAVSTVPNVKEVRAVSKEGISTIKVQFNWDVDLAEATNDIRDKIDIAKPSLPRDADSPRLFKFDFSMFPVVIIGVNADENKSYPKLKKIIEDKISDRIKRIPGVANASLRGGLTREIHVLLDKQKLKAYNITLDQISAIIKAGNVTTPGGHLKVGNKDYLIRVIGELNSVEELEQLVVTWNKNRPVLLKDIAKVEDDFEEKTEDVLINGKKAMIVFINKQSGANTVEVSNLVQQELKKIQESGILPDDVETSIVIDSADFIKQSVDNLTSSVLWGGIFVFLITLIFLRGFRASFIIAVAIPTSLIITFVFMYIAGYTINQVSLSSLAIAIGMVVDNAIVVLDNISQRRAKGERAKEGSIYGSSEVGMAIVASTLTTVAIFIPIIFVGGITKVLFGQLAIIVTMALLASLFVALTLIPMLCSKILKIKEENEAKGKLYEMSENGFKAIESTYSNLLSWTLRNKFMSIVIVLAIFGLTIFAVKLIGTEFMPEQDNGMFTILYDLPVGTPVEKTAEISQEIAKIVEKKTPFLRNYIESYGAKTKSGGPPSNRDELPNNGMLRVILKSKSERNKSVKEVIAELRPEVEKIAGAEIKFSTEDPIQSMMFGGGKDISIDIMGYDLDAGRQYAEDIKQALMEIEGVSDIEISREMGSPEIQISNERIKASGSGLTVYDVGRSMETYFSGRVAAQYREGGDEYDILIRLKEDDRNKLRDLRDIYITAPNGMQIPLSSIAEINMGTGPTKIERKNQERIITVGAAIHGRDLGSVVKEAEEKLSAIHKPEGFSYVFAGKSEEQKKSFGLLLLALILGCLLVYMVMASQFESLRDPFIIFFSIPFAFIGSVWILVITGQTLSIISFIGVIMLVGIVVNNGIVLISYIGILRQRGMSLEDAITTGGRSRLRPVLMTTLTTIFGLLPMALSRGEGSEVWVPLSLTVIGGLLVSTVITLLFMPMLYSLFESHKDKIKKALGGQ